MRCTSDQEDLDYIDRILSERGFPRTRENVIIMMFGEVPSYWDEGREEQLPLDIQVRPAPRFPLGH